jgi:hypothetical protein
MIVLGRIGVEREHAEAFLLASRDAILQARPAAGCLA